MGFALFSSALGPRFFHATLQCLAGTSVFETALGDAGVLEEEVRTALDARRWKRDFVFEEPLFRLHHRRAISPEALLQILSRPPGQKTEQTLEAGTVGRKTQSFQPKQHAAPPDAPLNIEVIFKDEESVGFILLDALPFWICGADNPPEAQDTALLAERHKEWVKKVLALGDLPQSHPFAEVIEEILGRTSYFNESVTPSSQQSMFHLVYPLVLQFVWQMNRFRIMGQVGDTRREGNAVTAQMLEVIRIVRKIAKTLEEIVEHPLLLQDIDHKLLDLVIQAGLSPYIPKLRPDIVFLALLKQKVPERVGKAEWVGGYRRAERMFREDDCGLGPFDYPDVLVPMDGMDDGASRIQERIRMLQDGPIYIKPSEGSMGRGVVAVSWDSRTVSWKSADPWVVSSLKPDWGGDLTGFLEALETLYQSRHLTSYAEGKIATPLIRGGKTWEIRMVLSALDVAKGPVKPKFSYAKIGSNQVTNNRSQGGTSGETKKIVWEAFRALHPSAKKARLRKKVEKFLEDLWVAAYMIVSELGAHFTGLKEQFLPDFPMEIVGIDDVALDFMGMVVGKGEEKTLKPCLVDVNFNYGTKGLGREDRLAQFAFTFLMDEFSEQWFKKFFK